MATTQQGVPSSGTPFSDPSGRINIAWYRFFLNLWQRTGGAQQVNPSGTYTGEIKPFAGATIPAGFLLCQGQAVGRSVYPALFTEIGTLWGVGDGVSTFNVPDLRGRSLLGSGGPTTLAGTGGASFISLPASALPTHSHAVQDLGHTHVFTGAAHTHTVSDPTHTHTLTDPGHLHASTTFTASTGTSGATGNSPTSGNTGTSSTGITVAAASTGITNASTTATGTNGTGFTGVTVLNSGSGSPFSIQGPYAGVNYIIKT